jgi:hypothetical protein
MASGFIEADVSSIVTLANMGGAGSSLSNNWAMVPLTTHSTVGTKMDFPTSGVRWSHIEIILDTGASFSSLTAAVRVFFSWDSAGNNVCFGPSSNALLVPGQGDDNLAMTTHQLVVDVVPSMPPEGVANTVYCWISGFSVTTNTPELKRARLYWHELSR